MTVRVVKRESSTVCRGMRLRKVRLHGALGEQFGREFDMSVKTPAEAVRLLEANFPGKFCTHVRDKQYQVVVGSVDATGTYCSPELLTYQFPKGDIHFIPVPFGAGGRGKGIFMVILGVVLIATAFTGAFLAAGAAAGAAGAAGAGGAAAAGATSGAAAGAAAAGTFAFGNVAFWGVTWGSIALFGTSLLLGGISSLMTPTPKVDQDYAQAKEEDKNRPSFLFNGAVNVAAEGATLPIVYGRMLTGSVVVAGAIESIKLDPAATSDNVVASRIIGSTTYTPPA